MKKRILVVDDFSSLRRLISEMLEQRGYAVLCAANGREAYDLLLHGDAKVDLVLTDYNMPTSDGLDLLNRIKSNPAVAKVPVAFLTTEQSAGKIKVAKEAGLACWIKKPIHTEAFFTQIESILFERSFLKSNKN